MNNYASKGLKKYTGGAQSLYIVYALIHFEVLTPSAVKNNKIKITSSSAYMLISSA